MTALGVPPMVATTRRVTPVDGVDVVFICCELEVCGRVNGNTFTVETVAIFATPLVAVVGRLVLRELVEPRVVVEALCAGVAFAVVLVDATVVVGGRILAVVAADDRGDDVGSLVVIGRVVF